MNGWGTELKCNLKTRGQNVLRVRIYCFEPIDSEFEGNDEKMPRADCLPVVLQTSKIGFTDHPIRPADSNICIPETLVGFIQLPPLGVATQQSRVRAQNTFDGYFS
jgi:hypothetical protein